MLILSRRRGENILIGEGDDQITVTVLEVRGKQVRIGLEAPDNVTILRGELEARTSKVDDSSDTRATT